MRKLLAAAVLTLATAGIAAPAAAGGWAVTTLDPLAGAPVAGEPFDVGFTVLQHGRTPVSLADAAIVVIDAAGDTSRFVAVPDGPLGHHLATVEIPTAGSFQWAVESGFGTQQLGVVQVGSDALLGGGDGDSPWTLPLFVVAAVLAGLGMVDLARSGRRISPAA